MRLLLLPSPSCTSHPQPAHPPVPPPPPPSLSTRRRLLGVSAHALTANSGVITTTILLNLASFLALIPLWTLTGELPCFACCG